MQFKHPEILYVLFLLIIPIIVHLFQLRRFQKVEFTNVKFLKDLISQTRKSSQLKKWLTLITRMLILAGLIFAFAQPYFSNNEQFNTKSETVIYLDNSFSMQAKGANGTLLNAAIQELLESVDENETISFFTNDVYFPNTTLKAIKNELIQLQYAPSQLTYDAAVLKGKQAFSKDNQSLKHLIMISDFQQKTEDFNTVIDSTFSLKLVQLQPELTNNVAIDSAYISKKTSENIELTVNLSNQGSAIENLPISVFNDVKLIAKSAVAITDKSSATFTLPLQNSFNGKLVIEDANLQYDNSLFFNLEQAEHINVLAINDADDSFLKKIYTKDEFNYLSSQFKALNYNIINDQNLIILNELKTIPNPLITALKAFTNNGGTVLIIPSSDIDLISYNQTLKNHNTSKFSTLISEEKKVTSINYSHPILQQVFDKKVSNFQYPKVQRFYKFSSVNSASILSYENGDSFLSSADKMYVFSAALNSENSNFKNAPLIVPILYNIGKQSLKISQLYYTIATNNTIDISAKLAQDDILTLKNNDHSIIPLQQTFTNKVALTTNEYPDVAGIIGIYNKDTRLKNLSFNFNRDESNLNYYNLKTIEGATVSNSIITAINDIKSATNINELWKWFVIFALTFLVIEMLILKLLK
ncbi:BatA domain-containing protein [Lacinutrix undariae]